VTLFAVGHSTALLFGVLGGLHASAYIADAIIGLSVASKAFYWQPWWLLQRSLDELKAAVPR
jgi:HupE / UreJ protein